MKNGLLETIKSRGYWRINFQPRERKRFQLLKEALTVVEKSHVSLRGWDFPHMPRKDDEYESIRPCGEYYEGWCDWGPDKEFWRIYMSTQFIIYRALKEDWSTYIQNNSGTENKKLLGILGTIYELTEALEFLSRLGQQGLYSAGVKLSVTLFDTEQRELFVDDRNRSSLFYPRVTGALKINYEEEFPIEDIVQNSTKISNGIIAKIFDAFGFDPGANSIMTDQQKLIQRQI